MNLFLLNFMKEMQKLALWQWISSQCGMKGKLPLSGSPAVCYHGHEGACGSPELPPLVLHVWRGNWIRGSSAIWGLFILHYERPFWCKFCSPSLLTHLYCFHRVTFTKSSIPIIQTLQNDNKKMRNEKWANNAQRKRLWKDSRQFWL